MTNYEISKERFSLAKKKSLVEYLKREGYELTDNGSYYSCLSPLRGEKLGSFFISKKTGKWKDYGDGRRGDIIDFVSIQKNISIKEAVDFLLSDEKLNLPVYEPPKICSNSVQILSVEPLSHPYLCSYITERKINEIVGKTWLKQVIVKLPNSKNPDKEIILAGFKNDSGGYELRNKYRKIGNSPKNITTIVGTYEDNKILLFEGNPDFLSYLTYYGYFYPPHKSIVLNSISFLGGIIPMLQGKIVEYWGQSDKAGNKGLARLKKEGINVVDKRYVYKGYKDFNALLKADMGSKKIRKILNFF